MECCYCLPPGLSLEEGLCHEMGHTLSLGHSLDKSSIMFPSIQPGRPRVQLSNDDIRGIQSLYGRFNGQVCNLFAKNHYIEL